MNIILSEMSNLPFDNLIENNIEYSNESFVFIDEIENGKTYLSQNNLEKRLLKLLNESKQELIHIAVDKGIFTDHQLSVISKQCDTIIIVNSEIHFIELKYHLKFKNFTKKSKGGRTQIGNTITYFKSNGFSENNKTIFAFVANQYASLPKFTNRIQNIALQFQIEYKTKAIYSEGFEIKLS